MVAPVLEPLKVRLITKMAAHPSYVMRCLQKSMWKHLNRYPQFKLTGCPLESTDLVWLNTMTNSQLEGKLDAQGRVISFDKWVSGDYSSATDLLNINYTLCCLEEYLISAKVTSNLSEIARRLLGPNILNYPISTRYRFAPGPVVQSNGQLMGCILSFPILCAINLACYWKALESYTGRAMKMKNLPVLVNGDDILFKSNDDFYEVWKKTVKQVGFELSVGKNYIHSNVLTANSEFYEFKFVHNKPQLFSKVGYLNLGLLSGQSKVIGRESGLRARPLWDQYNDMIDGAFNQTRAKNRFLYLRSDEIQNLTSGGKFNLFLPFMRGGLGFEPVDVFRITSTQRRLATAISFELNTCIQKNQKPKGLALGLVTERKSSSVDLERKVFLKLKRIVDLTNDDVLYETKCFHMPRLLLSIPSEESKLRVRRPKSAELLASKKFERMSDKQIMDWDFVLVRQ